MGRPAVDKPRKVAPNRQKIWDLIRELKTFTINDLAHQLNMNVETVKTYIQGLNKAGYVEVKTPKSQECKNKGVTKKRGAFKSAVYKLINDTGHERPMVDKHGIKTTAQGTGRDYMWRTMKMMKSFNARELAITASNEEHSVSEQEAKHYIQYLNKAGYLLLIATSTGSGKNRTQARYRFNRVKNTGPRAPMIQRVKQVYDPNINEVVYTPEPRDL